MKKLITMLVLIVAATTALMVAPVYRVTAELTELTETVAAQLVTEQGGWQVLGSFTATGAEPTGLTDNARVAERTLSTIRAAINVGSSGDEKMVLVGPLGPGANAMRFRNIGVGDGGDHVYEIWTATLDDDNPDPDFSLRGIHTFKTGTQASSTAGYEFADTRAVTSTLASTTSWTVANPGGNLVAGAFIDLQGDNMVLIVPTTLDDDSKMLGKDY